MSVTKEVKAPKPKKKDKPRLSPKYRVLIHNDDVTTFDFVIEILTGVFRKEVEAACDIAMEAHKKGVALVEVMPLEVAELRIDQAVSKARSRKFPLTLTCEPE